MQATETKRGLDRSEISFGEFTDMLSFEGSHEAPSPHAPILRDDPELLIYATRSKNTDSQWQIRDFRVIGMDVTFRVRTADRADLAAMLIEVFGGENLNTDERNVGRETGCRKQRNR